MNERDLYSSQSIDRESSSEEISSSGELYIEKYYQPQPNLPKEIPEIIKTTIQRDIQPSDGLEVTNDQEDYNDIWRGLRESTGGLIYANQSWINDADYFNKILSGQVADLAGGASEKPESNYLHILRNLRIFLGLTQKNDPAWASFIGANGLTLAEGIRQLINDPDEVINAFNQRYNLFQEFKQAPNESKESKTIKYWIEDTCTFYRKKKFGKGPIDLEFIKNMEWLEERDYRLLCQFLAIEAFPLSTIDRQSWARNSFRLLVNKALELNEAPVTHYLDIHASNYHDGFTVANNVIGQLDFSDQLLIRNLIGHRIKSQGYGEFNPEKIKDGLLKQRSHILRWGLNEGSNT